jgi:Flp pilus assembly protein TadD
MQYLSPILIGLGFCIGQVAFSQTSNVEKGLALFQHGQYEGAVRAFEEANRVPPNKPTLQNMVGLANSKLGRLDEADLHFEKAMRLNPGFPIRTRT